MGFGIMIMGCFLMLLGAFTAFAPFTYALGSAIVLYSLKELIKQNKLFLASMIFCAVEFVLSMVYMIVYVFSISATATSVFSIILQISNLALCVLLLTAIFVLARAVDLPSLQRKVIVAYIFAGIYFVSVILINTAFRNNLLVKERVSVIVFFTQIIYVALTLLVIANSYMRICYEDDKNMDNKTGNGALDFLNEKLNRAMTPKEKKNMDKNKGEKK